jgi:hypothetical protein
MDSVDFKVLTLLDVGYPHCGEDGDDDILPNFGRHVGSSVNASVSEKPAVSIFRNGVAVVPFCTVILETTFPRNVGTLQPVYTAPNPRTTTPLFKLFSTLVFWVAMLSRLVGRKKNTVGNTCPKVFAAEVQCVTRAFGCETRFGKHYSCHF